MVLLGGFAAWRLNTYLSRRDLGLCTACGHAPHAIECAEYVTQRGHPCCCAA